MKPIRTIGIVMLILFVGFGMGRLIVDGRPENTGPRQDNTAALKANKSSWGTPQRHKQAV
jgi:hypothetical protein